MDFISFGGGAMFVFGGIKPHPMPGYVPEFRYPSNVTYYLALDIHLLQHIFDYLSITPSIVILRHNC